MSGIDLLFRGYWREVNKNGVPAESGIYCVYTCTYDPAAETVSLKKLLYIGESENAHDRLSRHERLNDWQRYLAPGQTLCYSFAAVNGQDRLRAEAAMINHHKPPCNSEYKGYFPYGTTLINTSGRNALLSSEFTVYLSF